MLARIRRVRRVESLAPYRAPRPVPDPEPVEATDEELVRWAAGEAVCRKAFGVKP